MIDLEAMRRDVELANPSGTGCDLYAAIDAAQRCSAHVLALIGEVDRLRAEVAAFRSSARIWVAEYEMEWGDGRPLSLAEADALVDADLAPDAREKAMAVLRQNGLLGEGWGAPDE